MKFYADHSYVPMPEGTPKAEHKTYPIDPKAILQRGHRMYTALYIYAPTARMRWIQRSLPIQTETLEKEFQKQIYEHFKEEGISAKPWDFDVVYIFEGKMYKHPEDPIQVVT